MNTLFFTLLIVILLFILMKLGKVRASSKQTDRDDRINWFGSKDSRVDDNLDRSNIIEGEAEEIKETNEKSL
jgi:hypothetical protein